MNLARSYGLCLPLSSFTWLTLSKRCSTLRLTSLAAVCERPVCCIARRKQPTLKTFQKVDVGQSSEKGALFPGRDQSARCCSLCTARGLWEALTLRSISLLFFFHLRLRSPNLHLLLPMLLCMCDLGECRWDLSFKFCGKYKPVTLVLQDPFYSTSRFPEIKIKLCFSFEAYIWDIIESHMYCRGLLNCCIKYSCCLTSKDSIAVLNISLVLLLSKEIKNS